MDQRSRVPLPADAQPPVRVFVSGVPQEEGRDYRVVGRDLVFERALVKERLGFWRWTAMFFALFGSYGRNDVVDIQYQVNGRTKLATDVAPAAAGQDPRSTT